MEPDIKRYPGSNAITAHYYDMKGLKDDNFHGKHESTGFKDEIL